jgi:hypothetical protein
VDVAPGDGHADAEPGGKPGVGVTVAQIREDEQGLMPGVRARRVCLPQMSRTRTLHYLAGVLL